MNASPHPICKAAPLDSDAAIYLSLDIYSQDFFEDYVAATDMTVRGRILLPHADFITRWDDWVPQDRLRKLTDDNKELAANLKKDLIQQSKPPAASKNPMAGAKRARASEISSSRDGTPANRGNKRTKDNDIQLEQDFVSRPMIKLPLPDTLKSLLVDDWEFVTKQMLLVPVPSKAPANFILDSYFEDEKSMRRLGSAEADILEEVVQGLKVYFERSVGKVLLYRFEREQWSEVSMRTGSF